MSFNATPWIEFGVMCATGLLVARAFQLAALWLLFNPTEFRGYRLSFFRRIGLQQLGIEGLGWQGLIPAQYRSMATIAVALITQRLLPLDEIIRRIPTDALTQELTPPMQQTAVNVCHEVMLKHKTGLWERLPGPIQNRVVNRLRSIVPSVCRDILTDLQNKPDYYLHLNSLVLDVVSKRPELVSDLFKNAGRNPMRYLVQFATVGGMVAGAVLALTASLQLSWYWILATGVLLGAVVNRVAVDSLFYHPEHGRVRIGQFTGFFFRDQQHIAELFAQTAADEVLTPENIVLSLCRGPHSDNLKRLIHSHVYLGMDTQFSSIKPLLVSVLGAEDWQAIKRDAAQAFSDKLESHLLEARDFLEDSLHIEPTIRQRLEGLPPLEFEHALRPVFSRYEWMMPLLGTVWGALLAAVAIAL